MTRDRFASLRSVCEASGDQLTAYAHRTRKDERGHVPCPVCGKVVMLRIGGYHGTRNTIPRHHVPSLTN